MFRFTVVALITVLILNASTGTAAKPSPSKPHVLMVLVDDMGYGDPGCFNRESKIATPNIDGLAKAGMRFTDAHASGPLCHMSRYGLMTGRYPFRINVNQWPRQPLIGDDEITLPSLMRDSGYRTAMVGKWHVGFEEKGYDKPLRGGPFDRGFESFFGIRASTDIPPYFYIRDTEAVAPPTERIEANATDGWSPIQGEFWREGLIAPGMKLENVLPRFTDEACDVIRSHKGKEEPLMLYVAFPAPHTPWLPSEPFRGRSKAGMYGDFMEMVDAMIGQILNSLDQAGMAEDTMVIFTSDNGPVWYETDVERFGHDSSGGLRGMKADAWECGHRMPFIVRWPGTVAPGSQCDATVSFVDLLATMNELVGADVYQGRTTDVGPDSFSFLSHLTEQQSAEPQRKSLALKSGRGLMTLRRGDWKLIDGVGSGGFSGRDKSAKGKKPASGVQLYNLAEDLGETDNVAKQHPDIVASLREAMATIAKSPRSRDLKN